MTRVEKAVGGVGWLTCRVHQLEMLFVVPLFDLLINYQKVKHAGIHINTFLLISFLTFDCVHSLLLILIYLISNKHHSNLFVHKYLF